MLVQYATKYNKGIGEKEKGLQHEQLMAEIDISRHPKITKSGSCFVRVNIHVQAMFERATQLALQV
jgi:hypothetical protein